MSRSADASFRAQSKPRPISPVGHVVRPIVGLRQRHDFCWRRSFMANPEHVAIITQGAQTVSRAPADENMSVIPTLPKGPH